MTTVGRVSEREAAELAAVAAATRVDEAMIQDLGPLVKDAFRARKAR